MAQAVFDDHPLEEYLRESGESPLIWPGTTPELQRELDPNFDAFDDVTDDVDVDWCPQMILELLEILHSHLSPPRSTNHHTFVERFKYNVISSSLLAPSPPSSRPRHSTSIPGKLHVRACSLELDRPPSPPPLPTPTESTESIYGPTSYTALCAAISLSIGHPLISFLFIMGTFYSLYLLYSTTETSKHDMTSSFNALDDLITANNMWDSVIQDAITFLDNEEHNHLRSSSGLASPSRIRVALLSCLQTTQTQCDSVRHIFSALTSPTELAQLAEMYAPPSPSKSELSLHPYALASPRSPLSPSPITPVRNKRSTWNGSYSGLGYYGSPISPLMRRRAKHRLNFSDVFQDTNSAPGTPLSYNDKLDGEGENENLAADHFGAAALDLHRSRRQGGLDTFRSPPFHSGSPGMRQSMSLSSKFASNSRLLHSSLRQTLEGALGAKRYACAHLLALRFKEDEDEGYWEDVRSMMGLLSSTLTDGYSRLQEALTEMEQENLREQIPTPDVGESPELDRDVHEPRESIDLTNLDVAFRRQKRASTSKASFAPMPSHISKFAAHVAAISTALDDAREHLNQCVSALKNDSDPFGPTSSPSANDGSPSGSAKGPDDHVKDTEGAEPPAVQAYERLRRELGLALRECERGKEQLMTIVHPPPLSSDGEAEGDAELDDLPGLGHDASDDSDKADNPNSPSDDEGDDARVLSAGTIGVGIDDDATRHLLLAATAQHLPLPGIEEVFEADTGAKVAFTRERSKLSREERIRIAKARREVAAASAVAGRGLGVELAGAVAGCQEVGGEDDSADTGLARGAVRERWGPGGEVVQELKDVIWKVGERRRRMVPQAPSPQSHSPEQENDHEHDHLPPTSVVGAVLETLESA